MLQLLQQEPIKWRAPIIFDLLSGLHRAKLLGLRWKDIDLENRVISIVQTSNYVSGKGVYIDTPKSEDSNRCLKVSHTAILILLAYKSWQDGMHRTVGDVGKARQKMIEFLQTKQGGPGFPLLSPSGWGNLSSVQGCPPVVCTPCATPMPAF